MDAVKAKLLTRHEAAAFSGVSVRAINKVGEQKVVKPVRIGRTTMIQAEETAAISLLSDIQVRLPVTMKRQIRNWVVDTTPRVGERYEISAALAVQMTRSALDACITAKSYAELRDRWIEVDPAKMVGAPVIAGTRVPVRTLVARLESDEPREQLLEDFPHVPQEAYDVAIAWVKMNPQRGRPVISKG